ncbi:MAG: DUF1294 domain-containing protein [Oscillospiraceae bacterium]
MKILFLFLLALLLFCSLISFFLCFWDKRAAQKERRRIPEKRFFLLALLGGGPGLWIGMHTFHHKTRHLSFRLIAPATTLLWLGMIGAVLYFL